MKFRSFEFGQVPFESPPSRAAWIEIRLTSTLASTRTSPPSRAAWIEIPNIVKKAISHIVAAFTGGVD